MYRYLFLRVNYKNTEQLLFNEVFKNKIVESNMKAKSWLYTITAFTINF